MPTPLRDALETRQVAIYFAAIVAGIFAALLFQTASLYALMEPALALMLFVTFLQVPLVDLGRAALRGRFILTLVAVNFIAIPLLVLVLIQFAPADPIVRLGVLMVLLAPCIDYVVTFSHIGRADARSLLAATPILLLLQMLLLPVFLNLFLGSDASGLVRIGPFVEAFIWLIALPLVIAALLQLGARRSSAVQRTRDVLDHLPVPATALVLFLVFAAVVPQLGLALSTAIAVVPIYLAFAALAPLIGFFAARSARLPIADIRAVAFSASTRNSLVILPLAFAVPDATPLLPAVIVAQTVVELFASLVYMKVMPRLGETIP